MEITRTQSPLPLNRLPCTSLWLVPAPAAPTSAASAPLPAATPSSARLDHLLAGANLAGGAGADHGVVMFEDEHE